MESRSDEILNNPAIVGEDEDAKRGEYLLLYRDSDGILDYKSCYSKREISAVLESVTEKFGPNAVEKLFRNAHPVSYKVKRVFVF